MSTPVLEEQDLAAVDRERPVTVLAQETGLGEGTAFFLPSPGDPWTEYTYEQLLADLVDQDEFIVPNLLARVMLLFGKPKAGKSAVVVNLCNAIITGAPFLGAFPLVNAQGEPLFNRVIVLAADASIKREYAARLQRLGVTQAAGLRLRVLHRALDSTDWERLTKQLRPDSRTLVVLDSLTMATEGGTADDQSVKVALRGATYMSEAGASVIVVGYQSDWGPATPPKGQLPRPQGHTAVSAGVRWLMHVGKPNPFDDKNVELTCWGNAGRVHKYALQRRDSAADLHLVSQETADELSTAVGESQKQTKRKKDDRNREIADLIVQSCQGLNQEQAAAWLEVHEVQGVSGKVIKASTAVGYFSRKAQFGGLARCNGGVWSLSGTS